LKKLVYNILNRIKFIKICFLIISLSFIGNGYGQTADITEGCFPLTVQFTAPGVFPTYFWDFKDGASSTLQNPSNTFITAGTYVVEFKETIAGPIIGTVTINIYAKPVPAFSTDVTSGCVPLTVNFTDTTLLNPGIIITGYSWVFGDGGTSTGANTSHTFFTQGNYYVSLELTTNLPSCDVTLSYPNLISLTNPPLTSFTTTPSPATSCTAPLLVSFNNTSSGSGAPLTYSWNFGNGNTSILANPLDETYLVDGSYQILLTATDTNGCSSSSQVNVSVGKPIANFQIPDTLCIGVADTMINLSPAGSYTWNFGAGATPITSALANPIVVFNTPGFHSITLTINGTCPDDTTIVIFVEDPIADFTSSPTYSCSDPMIVTFTPFTTNAATYQWNFGNGQTSTLQNPVITFIVEDTTIYSINGPNNMNNYFSDTLTITTYAGCIATFISIDTIHEPNAVLVPNVSEGCLPLTVQFSDFSISNINEPIVNWEWIFGDGNSTTAGNNSPQSNTYTTMGQYNAYLIITNSAGCIDTSFHVIINVGDVITPLFSVDLTNVCPGDSVQFTDLTASPMGDSIDAWHYTTEGGMMFSCFQNPNPSWAYTTETGPQNVTLTVGYNGCYSSVTMPGLVNVMGPIAEMNYFCTCEQPFTVNFVDSSHSATSIIWNFGDGDTSSLANPTHIYAATGDYQVILTAFNSSSGCPISYDTSIVRIRDIQASFGSDSLLCQNIPSFFDASASQDVYGYCNKGYTWYFSDPGTRPITTGSATDSITFPVTGTNEVTLVVTDINGCKDTISSLVEVYGIDAGFTSDKDTICLSALVTFSDTSTSDTTITNWYWDFGDGQNYTNQDTSHNYFSSTFNTNPLDDDTIQVFLTITNAIGCLSVDSMYIYVYKPISNITASDNTICSGTTVNFTATDFTSHGSNLNFNWDFDDGINTSNLQNPSNTFNSGGNYNVVLIYQEISSGCIDSSNITILVEDFPIAGFESPSDSLLFICPNDNVLFTDTTVSTYSPLTYFWDFGNSSTSIFANPGTTYPNSGTYTVELIVTVPAPYGCSDTTSQTYIVKGPVGNFYTDLMGDTICRLDSVNFTIFDTIAVDTFYWDFGDGTTGPGVSPISHQYTFVPPFGQTVAKLIMTNADGSCPLTVDTIISIYEVIADFDRNFNDIDTAICFQDYPFTNTSTNADYWYWDFGDGQTSLSQDPLTHSYANSGVYLVTLGVQNTQLTCTDTITKVIILHPIPDVIALGDTICEGDIGLISVENPSSNWSYWWESSPAILIINDSTPNASSQPLTNTDYTVHVVDSNDCINSTTTTLYVINELFLSNFDTIVGLGDTVYLPLNVNPAFYTFTWTPEAGLSCLDCAPPYVHPLENLFYHLEITDIFGCFTTEADYTINVHPETFVKVPTTFTPNGDGVNDIIYIKGWGIKELIEFKIFNRWGELIFETDDENVGWNGYYKGVLQNNDIYVYKIMVISWRDETQTLEGHINLMR